MCVSKTQKYKEGSCGREVFFLQAKTSFFFQTTFVAHFFLVKGGWRRVQRLVKSQRNSHLKNEVADEQRVARNR